MTTKSGNYPRQLGTRQRWYTGPYKASTPVSFPPVVVDMTGGNWTRTSSVTPNFFNYFLSGKRRDLPMNFFNFEMIKIIGKSGFTRARTTWADYPDEMVEDEEVGYFPNDNAAFLFFPNSSVFTELDLKARSKLLSGLKNQDFNLGVALGEGRQTANLIANKALQVAKAGRALRKADFRGAAMALGVSPKGKAANRSRHQSVAQNWLELQYGWKPLLSDIYGAAQFLATQNNWLPRSRLQTSASKKLTRVLKAPWISSGSLRDLQSDLYVVKYIVYFSEPPGGNPLTALGLTNPLAVAWELVPFSFVADWFLPLGDYFNNIDATFGNVFVKGCVTTFWRGHSTRTYLSGSETYMGPYGMETHSFESNVALTGEGVQCRRTALTGFPSNHFPQFKNPFSKIHVANALALVAQVFKK